LKWGGKVKMKSQRAGLNTKSDYKVDHGPTEGDAADRSLQVERGDRLRNNGIRRNRIWYNWQWICWCFIIVSGMLLKNKEVIAQGAELLEKSISLSVGDINPASAKRSLQESAVNRISEELIRDVIGEDRFQKNRKKIEQKVIRQFQRYIPVVKVADFVVEGANSRANVQLKLSLRELNILLQDNGLLAESEGAGVILPMISIVDRVNSKFYYWWQGSLRQDQAYWVNFSKWLEGVWRNVFFKNNFYVIKPIENRLYQQIPAQYQHDRLSISDFNFFTKTFNAPLVIDGQVIIEGGTHSGTYKIELRFNLLQVATGRLVANVVRRFETEVGTLEQVIDRRIRDGIEGVAQDLSLQAKDMWQRGGVSARRHKLVLNGRLGIQQIELIKEVIRQNIAQTKKMSEHFIQSEEVQWDIETNLGPQELASKIDLLKFPNIELKRVSVNNSTLAYRLVR